MLTSSVRRGALSSQPSAVLGAVFCNAPQAAAPRALSYRSHQRRHSSSKPSSPADGSNGIAAGPNLPATATQTRPDGTAKSAKSSGRRKAKDVAAACTVKGRDEAMQNLPSVPNTSHVKPKDFAASAFFSLFRPMSISSSFPKAVTDEDFANIFAPRAQSPTRPSPSEVISTLSNAANKLETASQGDRYRWNSETDEIRVSVQSVSVKGSAENEGQPRGLIVADGMPFPSHILEKYLPFHPPPPPKPTSASQSSAKRREVKEMESPAQHRVYKATLTIEESTDENGDITYVAHNPQITLEEPEPVPTRFIERMLLRQERYDEYLERRYGESDMHAISVKRIRRLKMKKHKYKKLMRRTRNLRRRQDRN